MRKTKIRVSDQVRHKTNLYMYRSPEASNLDLTRIVRGSDYSPASELFSRVRKTMTGNNPKLDLVNVDAH